MRTIKWRALGFAALAAAGAAHADWQHAITEDAFNGDKHIGLALAEPNYGLGFRCTEGRGDLLLIYMTPERADLEAVKGLTMLGPKLLVIVDDAPRVSLPANVELSAGDDRLAFASDAGDVKALLAAARSAKRRVAVAIEVAGQVLHSVSFRARGSGRALAKVADACFGADE